MYQPFRQLGVVNGELPLSIQKRGQQYFITSAVDNHFQIYDAEKMHLKISAVVPKLIETILAYKDYTFITAEGTLYCYNRQELEYTRPCPNGVERLLMFGNLLLLQSPTEITVFDTADNSENIIKIQNNCVVHPAAYVNKILISNGKQVFLYNIMTMKRLFTFDVSCEVMVQSPTLDVIAMGGEQITILNIKENKKIMILNKPASLITFMANPYMASAYETEISIWNLETRQIIYSIHAHEQDINTLLWLDNILLSSGNNSIKQWVFEDELRELKQRSGHWKQIRNIKPAGSSILSTSYDGTFRITSLLRDAQNTTLSQKGANLPMVTAFDYRQHTNQWEDIVTCHYQSPVVYSWSFQKKSIGSKQFKSLDSTPVKSVCISRCGNFCFLGAASGNIYQYNIQSGLFKNTIAAHGKEVTSMVTDDCNMILISGSIDGTIKMHSFSGKLLQTINIQTAISGISIDDDSRLISVSCDDLAVRLVDIDTYRTVRKFEFGSQINCVCFNDDGRQLIVGGRQLKIYDIVSGLLLSSIDTGEIIVAVTFIEGGLATCQTNSNGIYLWVPGNGDSKVDLSKVNSIGMDIDVLEPSIDEWKPVEDNLITLSTVPKSQWKNLLYLDNIKARNTAKEKVMEEKVPFLLETFEQKKEKKETLEVKEKVIDWSMETEFVKAITEKRFNDAQEMLKNMSPGKIDIQIQEYPTTEEKLSNLFAFFRWAVTKGKEIELIQATISRVLLVHGDILKDSEIDMHDVGECTKDMVKSLERDILYGLCLLDFVLE